MGPLDVVVFVKVDQGLALIAKRAQGILVDTLTAEVDHLGAKPMLSTGCALE